MMYQTGTFSSAVCMTKQRETSHTHGLQEKLRETEELAASLHHFSDSCISLPFLVLLILLTRPLSLNQNSCLRELNQQKVAWQD